MVFCGLMFWEQCADQNLQFVDREAGLCGLYGGQVKPPGDDPTGNMITLFEKAMYERLEAGKARI